jgi:molybdenum cofactor cytidylyltransferase
MISAVLLAAGKSERMGKLKQILPLDGRTFVAVCADNLLASNIGEVIVVTGYREAAIRAALVDRPVSIVYNPDYEIGMGSSIIRGVQSVASEATGILIALADQPLISTYVLNQVISEYQVRSSPLILIPTYLGKKGHPILLNPALRQEVVSIDPRIGLKQVTQAHASSIHYIEVSSDSVLLDFDYPEDLVRLPKNG